MPLSPLDPYLDPASIAVIGASSTNPHNVGSRTAIILKENYRGKLYLISPQQSTVGGVPTFPKIADIPGTLDLLIIAVPASAVVGVLEEAAAAGVRSALVFTAGFAEVGADGSAAQRRIAEIAEESGMRIGGPNTVGFLNFHKGLAATFFLPPSDPLPEPGPVAIVSQSGGFASYIDDLARAAGVNTGWLVATGNEVNISVTDVLAHLVERPEVRVIASFSEAIRDAQQFIEVALRAAELDKPFVVLKVGGSEAGRQAAMSHTASVAGSDEVFDAVCRQYGVLRAQSLEQMLDWLKVFQTGHRLEGDRLGILTGSGGSGVLMADCATQVGLTVPETPASDREIIEQLIPVFGSARNPVDVTAQAIASGVANYQKILKAMLDSEGFDAVVVGSGMRGDVAEEVSSMIAGLMEKSTKPLAVTWFSSNEDAKAVLVDAGVPVFSDGSRSVGAIGALHRHRDLRRSVARSTGTPVDANRLASARNVLASTTPGSALLESESKSLLALYGLPVTRERRAATPAEAQEAYNAFGDSPVALKILSRDLPHKSDVGGVALDLRGGEAVREAAEEMLRTVAAHAPSARIDGLLIQEMIEPGIELMCGLSRDQAFGPVIAVGLGGVLVEIVGEVALRRAPMTLDHARDAIGELAAGRLASHARGLDGQQAEAAARLMVTLGNIALELPEIAEIDINPLVVSASGLHIVDALIVTGSR